MSSASLLTARVPYSESVCVRAAYSARLPRALFVHLRCQTVIKFRPGEFYLVAVYLHPLLELQDDVDRQILIKQLAGARCALAVFSGDLIDKFLPSSKKRAESIMEQIDAITFRKQDSMGLPDLATVQNSVRKFETVLDDEIAGAPIFCLERIGNLSTDNLLDGASKGYAPEVLKVLPPNCIFEIDEAGRCLAFERATASGFHILRAVELSIKQYLTLIPGFIMPPLNRQNWGEYISLLKNNGASKNVTDTLQNVKDNYRNPLMHPEDVLEMKESISLFCICQAMIELLVDEIHRRGYI
jgi:hypothetical protein